MVFDDVNWIKLYKILEDISIDCNKRKIIYNLYNNEIAITKTEKGNYEEETKIAKGVRQGCNLLSTLFNFIFIYVKEPFKEIREENSDEIKISGVSGVDRRRACVFKPFPIAYFLYMY